MSDDEAPAPSARERDEAADRRDDKANTRDHSVNGALVWLFAALVIIGIVLCLLIGQVMRRLDDSTEVDRQQVKATQDLVAATVELQAGIDRSNQALEFGRYERLKFQAEERRLTCIDLQDGDTGATDEQYAECSKENITVPPEPEGYPG